MAQRPTIKDIAQKLNIHYSTVSRALRNHPDVNESTKNLVLEAAKEMNYHPDVFARNLKQKTSNIIGVIVPEIRHHFFAAVISGIEEVAYSAGYVIMVCQSNEQYEREVMNAKALLSNKVAGLLVSISQTTYNCDHFMVYKDHGIPLVFFDRICQHITGSRVEVDDYSGAYQAVEHLINRGRKRIYHIAGTKQLTIAQERNRGFIEALRAHDFGEEDYRMVWKDFQEKDGVKGMEEILDKDDFLPDAVFAVNDPVALGVYEVLKARGYKIPEDISVVGFSNNPISAFIHPSLTTVEQPSFEMGQKATELLLEQIENGEKEYIPKHEVLKTNLIIRQST